MSRKEKLRALAASLESINENQPDAVVGFDACIDSIVRPVEAVDACGNVSYFKTIGDFSSHLSNHKNLSCAIDIRLVSERIGGNMPNLSRGLTALGVPVNCIGTLGLPEPDSRFASVGKKLFSVGGLGSCIALQFDDGKVMLSNMSSAESLDYEHLEKLLGRELILELFGESRLVGFVNWAELLRATALWRGIAQCCWFGREADMSRILLIDLTDCGRRSAQEILEVTEFLKECGHYRRLVYTLNQNEANQLAAVLKLESRGEAALRGELLAALEADTIVVHRNDRCFLQRKDCSAEADGFYIEHPLISVGAGDTFNAALAFGLLNGFDAEQIAVFASLYAALYVEHGRCFSLPEVREELRRRCS